MIIIITDLSESKEVTELPPAVLPNADIEDDKEEAAAVAVARAENRVRDGGVMKVLQLATHDSSTRTL